jgi:hypothetical protein
MTAEEFLNPYKPRERAGGAVPIATYSYGPSVGGPDESEDSDTNAGDTSTGPNLTEGVASVNESVYPLGTVFRDDSSGEVYLAADRHGNRNPSVVDVFAEPHNYSGFGGTRNMSVIGSVPRNQIPTTREGVRELLATFGKVPGQLGFGPPSPPAMAEEPAGVPKARGVKGPSQAESGMVEIPGLGIENAVAPEAPYMARPRDAGRLKRIIVHGDVNEDADALLEYGRHRDPQRKNIDYGYHFYIGRDGVIKQGAPVNRITNHTLGENSDSIGIVIAGADEGKAPTPAQEAAAKKLISGLGRTFGIEPRNVVGLGELQPNRRDVREGGTIAAQIRQYGYEGQPPQPAQSGPVARQQEAAKARQQLTDAIAATEAAGYPVPHTIGKPDEPEGDRAPTIDMEHLVAALKKQEADQLAAGDKARAAQIASQRAYWENEIATKGMSATQEAAGLGAAAALSKPLPGKPGQLGTYMETPESVLGGPPLPRVSTSVADTYRLPAWEDIYTGKEIRRGEPVPKKAKLTAAGFLSYKLDPDNGTAQITDPSHGPEALQAMLHEGVISEEEFDKVYPEALQVQEGLAKLKELEAKAGSNAAVKAYLAGLPKGAAEFLGFVIGGYPGAAAGAAVGGPYAPLTGAVGGVVTGTAGAYAAGKAYDWLYKELADPKIRESVEAAIALHPYYNALGEITLPVATIPVSLANLTRESWPPRNSPARSWASAPRAPPASTRFSEWARRPPA